MAKKKKDAVKKKAAKASAKAELFAALAHAARASRGAVAGRLSASGLYAGQDVVIALIDAEGVMTPSAIAATLGVRAPTITKTINRLVSQGFVTKSASSSDGRMAVVDLTDAGREASLAVRQAHADCQEAACTEMGAKDVKALVKLLRQVEGNLKNAGNKGPLAGDSEPA